VQSWCSVGGGLRDGAQSTSWTIVLGTLDLLHDPASPDGENRWWVEVFGLLSSFRFLVKLCFGISFRVRWDRKVEHLRYPRASESNPIEE
jgi:hypothetical protein